MSADGDIIRNDFKHVGMSQPASEALARLEAAEAQRDALAETLAELENDYPGPVAARARAALAEAGLE